MIALACVPLALACVNSSSRERSRASVKHLPRAPGERYASNPREQIPPPPLHELHPLRSLPLRSPYRRRTPTPPRLPPPPPAPLLLPYPTEAPQPFLPPLRSLSLFPPRRRRPLPPRQSLPLLLLLARLPESSRFLYAKSILDLPLHQLLSLAHSNGAAPIRLALDVGGGTGTLAARLRLLVNATVLTTTMNLGAPYNEAAALRGVVPLHAPLQQRFPV